MLAVESLSLGFDVISVDADNGVQRGAGDFIITLLCITSSKGYCVLNAFFRCIGAAAVQVEVSGTDVVVRSVRRRDIG